MNFTFDLTYNKQSHLRLAKGASKTTFLWRPPSRESIPSSTCRLRRLIVL
jgi:hypothetical protein